MRLNELEADLRRSMFTEADIALFRAFAGEPSEDDLKILTKDLDIDSASYLYLLMLGILGFQKGWEHFPDSMTARISGIHRYEQVKNSSVTPWLSKRIGVLEKAGIPVMFTGNSATRIAFVPDVPRLMTGYDLTVRSGDYDRAAELLRAEIKGSDKNDFHDRTIKDLTVINLHKGVHDKRLFDEEDYWNSSSVMDYQAHKVNVPSFEDHLLQCLCMPYGQWMLSEKAVDRTYRLVGAVIMLKDKKVDVDRLSAIAKRACVSCHLRFELALILPYAEAVEGLDLEKIAGDQEYCNYLSKLIGYRDHPSVFNEYKLINSFYRPEDKKSSFREYIIRTRDIHSPADLARHLKRRGPKRKDSGSSGNEAN